MNYKLFGQSGLRVSELCLGTMGFGTEWKWGADKELSQKIFDAYANAGGNFLDTANRYTEGTSEKFVGDFIAKDRDHFVVATKYTLRDRSGDLNFAGNHRKNLMRSVKESLWRLNTDYIDVLWVHMWDTLTPTEEIMKGLEDLITRGMVHYIGISDTPAWVVSQANTMAQLRGWNQFVGLQIEYSLIQRTVEAELLPMAKAYGMTVTPWAPLAGGALTGKYLKGDKGRLPDTSIRLGERATNITKKVVEIADRLGVTASQVAINWTRQQKGQSVIPIVGATKESQMQDVLGCLKFELPADAINELNEVSKIELPFPQKFLNEPGVQDVLYGGVRDKMVDSRY
ncbi:MAG: aldo/keto reductase [Bacteroidota bacterium]|jgi:aryl-alcohol dehydrogenase-like predicted oxidoreductase|nr:aldo/keto reductase [Cytophagales bacterium]MCE2956556.1 aldo/keto reductase [Flammeovirgaceae bacterium]MCZ8069393.1 aldo/keto reductase [Cytophagales bacterium]